MIVLDVEGSGTEDQRWEDGGEWGAFAVDKAVRDRFLSGREGAGGRGMLNRRRSHYRNSVPRFCSSRDTLWVVM